MVAHADRVILARINPKGNGDPFVESLVYTTRRGPRPCPCVRRPGVVLSLLSQSLSLSDGAAKKSERAEIIGWSYRSARQDRDVSLTEEARA